MKRSIAISTLLFLLIAGPASAAGPDKELALAQGHIRAGEYSKAVEALDRAMAGVGELPTDLQPQATTAIHFYSALAYSGMEKDDDALAHLREVLRVSPEIRSVDPAKYPEHFVKLFSRARSELDGIGRFEEFYPGFASERVPETDDMETWEGSPAIEILASRAEKRDWRAAETAEERDAFFEAFWKRRDPTPDTPANEFRETFRHRVAFADSAFASLGHRGALSDRGRVFILLGEPVNARERPIRPDDNISVFNRGSIGIVDGTIEYWFYRRDQLPVEFSRPTVVYRFISHQGVGDHVLQKDGMATNILSMAASRHHE